jgi:hypothetical protein
VWHISNGTFEEVVKILRSIKCRGKALGIQNFVSIVTNNFAVIISYVIVIMNVMKRSIFYATVHV